MMKLREQPAKIQHIILPGLTLKSEQPVEGETVAAFLDRVGWDFRIPTVCSLNNLPVMRSDWTTTTISAPDRCSFISKPHGGGGAGSKMNSVFALVAVVALSVVAPWVAGSLFAAGSLGFYATVAAITIGGGLLIQSFLAPKPANTSSTDSVPQIYSLSASGNTAKPLQPIPVMYGRLKFEPPYASIPWGEFIGDDQYLNLLLCQGIGLYDREQILIDDTVLWDKNTGLNPAFTDVTFQFCDPGEPVTLFPSNVIAASEVDGQSITNDWLGGFIANTSGTTANALAYDVVLPGGLFSTNDNDSDLHSASVTLVLQARTVDAAGTPLSGWLTLGQPTITLNTRSPKRLSYKFDVAPGRWECRVSRTTAESTDTKVSDAVQWAQLRAFLQGSSTYPNVSLIAIRIKATAQLSQNSAKKFGVIQTRILPIWNGSAFVNQPTRNAFWAFYDAATNTVYGANLNASRVDFQEIYSQALSADTRGDTFNYVFDSDVTYQEAFDLILGSARSKTAWVGDILSVTRDEWKPIPQMLLTDQQTVRGSVSVDYIINDDTYADCVVGQFLNENTWGPAQLQYPPNSVSFTATKPSTIQIPGVTNPEHMMHEIGFLYRQAQLRRINITLDTEHDGRLLRFGSSVRVQSNLPTKWGQGGEINAYNTLTKTLTVDRNLSWTTGQTHYLELRDRGGHYWGPVAVARGAADNLLIVNTTDLASVEADLNQTLAAALDRLDGAEPPAFAFGIAGEFARNCIVLSGKPQDDKVTLNLAVDTAAVHDDGSDPVPVIPTAPVLQDPRVPLIANLTANFRQGVAEPVLEATWWPAMGAVYYRAAVSYDNGLSWLALPDTSEPQLSAVVSRAALRLRVSGVSTLQGPWSSVNVNAPDITIGADTVAPSSLKLGLQDYVMKQLTDTQGQVNAIMQNIAAVAADHDAATALNDIRTRQQIMSVAGGAKAAITIIQNALTSANSAFAQYQVEVSASFDDIQAAVTTNSQAIATGTGAVAALYSLTLDVNHYVSGFQSINDGSFAAFTIVANAFQVAQPGISGGAPIPVFQVLTVNGTAKLALRGDMYADGIITANKLNVTSLSAISANIGTVTAGVIRSADGLMIMDLNNKQFIIYGP